MLLAVPQLNWSGYLGGAGDDAARAITVDQSGCTWITGYTSSVDIAAGGFDSSYNGGITDAFVAKLNPNGSLAWYSYLGGYNIQGYGSSGDDYGNAIALDSKGNAWIVGATHSAQWVSGGFDATIDIGYDAFIAKINADGTLAWTSYLGGNGNDFARGVAIDGDGNAWITGMTVSTDFAVGGFDNTYNGAEADAFVAKINGDGTLAWTSYLGGSAYDEGNAIALDAGGNAWITGSTQSPGWTVGGFDTSYNGGISDAFVAKVNGNGSLAWSSYMGGRDSIASPSGDDYGFGIATDSEGNAWVTGTTQSDDWAVPGGFGTAFSGGYETYVSKINANGSLSWVSYLGGPHDEGGQSIALDHGGNVWVAGYSVFLGTGWTAGGFDTSYNGGALDAFVAQINSDGTLAFSSYLGGGGEDRATGIAVAPNGVVSVAGFTASNDWTSGGHDTSYNGGGMDAFVASIELTSPPTDIALSATTIAENEPVGSIVGLLSTSDVNAGDTFSYGLVGGSGSDDNGSFTISGSTLTTSAAFDFETKTSYSIRVRSTDQAGLSLEKVFAVAVTDVNEVPTGIAISNNSVQENQGVATVVGSFSTEDPDSGDAFSYTLVSGAGSTDNSNFTISGSALQTAVALDFEAKNSYSIRVRSNDQGGLYLERTFTIQVSNVNEVPTQITLTSTVVAENEPAGTAVGTLNTEDPDSSNTFTYTLVSGTGSADNASFTIEGNQLKTMSSFNHETKSSYLVRVRSNDQDGLYLERAFTIQVSDVNEEPTEFTLSGSSIVENSPAGTAIGELSASDPDAGTTLVYDIVGSSSLFEVRGNVLVTSCPLDYETQSSYSLVLRVLDPEGLSLQQTFTITVADVMDVKSPLIVNGTPEEDVITIGVNSNQIRVTNNGVISYAAFDLVSSIQIGALAGDDEITLLGVTLPTSISGGAGSDTILGGSGDDLIYGGDDHDSIAGNDGLDTIYGNFGDDVIAGGLKRDSILAGLGADTVTGGDGPDTVLGGDQQDLLRGGKGADYIEGRGKADTIYGGDGNDTLNSGAGSDLVFGEAGDDLLYAWSGGLFHDTLNGGDGWDQYEADADDLLEEVEQLIA